MSNSPVFLKEKTGTLRQANITVFSFMCFQIVGIAKLLDNLCKLLNNQYALDIIYNFLTYVKSLKAFIDNHFFV